MELKQAQEILRALADGIHPITGEILPETDSCNQPEVIRALHTVLAAFSAENARPASSKEKPAHAGKPWSAEEDQALCQMYDEGQTVHELCQYFGRSRNSIAARLVRLGKIKERRRLGR